MKGTNERWGLHTRKIDMRQWVGVGGGGDRLTLTGDHSFVHTRYRAIHINASDCGRAERHRVSFKYRILRLLPINIS
jgi:hypothetical protein